MPCTKAARANSESQAPLDDADENGELPEGWASSAIADIFNSWGGLTPSTSNAAYWGGKIPWVSSKDVKQWRIRAGTEFLKPSALEAARLRLCPKGSVLVVMRSGILRHSLPVAVLDAEVTINQDIKAFYCVEHHLNEWLALALRALEQQILNTNRKDGTTVQSIEYDQLKAVEIYFPPLAEQKRIVAKVEALLARVNAARGLLAKVPPILKRFRQAVLAAACSGRLTEDWRDSHTNIKKLEIESDGELPFDIPDTWRAVTLRKVAKSLNYGTSAKSQKDGKIPVLRMGNIQDGRLDWKDLVFTSDKEEIEKYALHPGAVLFNRTNSPELVGKTAVYKGERPAIFAGYLIRVTLTDSFDPDILNYCLNAPYGRQYCNTVKTDGVSQSNINAEKLGDFSIPLCPQEEQHEIVRRVEKLFKLADAIEKRVAAATLRAGRLTQAILAKAFRGELVPTEAELARKEGRPYEPASALLARIRAERAANPALAPGLKKRGRANA